MNELTKFYERAKQNAKKHMQKGKINAYYQDLAAMHHYKRLLESI